MRAWAGPAILAVIVFVFLFIVLPDRVEGRGLVFIDCPSPRVIDGDTIRCHGIHRSIRLAAIDAPDHRCTRRRTQCATVLRNGVTAHDATRALRRVLRRGAVRVRLYRSMTYGRHIGVLCARGVNVNDWMIRNEYATYKPTWNGAGRRIRCP